MARRIKEEPIVHQNRISDEAERLFKEKGIANTSMDEIARAAGYSKATLYVYFKNKDDIISFLTMKSMVKLKDSILKAINPEKSSKKQFMDICFALVDYQNAYPEYFHITTDFITLEPQIREESFYSQAYQAGEEINAVLLQYIKTGVQKKELRPPENAPLTILQLWGMVSGLIRLAAQKEAYIEQITKINKKEFLQKSFEELFRLLSSP